MLLSKLVNQFKPQTNNNANTKSAGCVANVWLDPTDNNNAFIFQYFFIRKNGIGYKWKGITVWNADLIGLNLQLHICTQL